MVIGLVKVNQLVEDDALTLLNHDDMIYLVAFLLNIKVNSTVCTGYNVPNQPFFDNGQNKFKCQKIKFHVYVLLY